MNRKKLCRLSALAMAAALLAPGLSAAADCSDPGIGTLYSVVRVSTSQGVVASGVVIGEGWVLTAAHVVESSTALNVSALSGESRSARLRSINSEMDLALLATDTSGMTPVAISADGMRSGEPVWAAGYPRDGDLTMSTGHYQNARNGRLQTNAYIDSGQSGGALFKCRKGIHQLAGIVHGFLATAHGSEFMNTGESLSVAAVSVRRFLDGTDHASATN